MDNWQKWVYKMLKHFVDDDIQMTDGGRDGRTIGINRREAYICMKALEAQEKAENPLLKVPLEDGS